jgi:cytochrome c biogenesis protein
VKVRRLPADAPGGGRTLVEVAGLDRSAGGDLSGEIDEITARLQAVPDKEGR